MNESRDFTDVVSDIDVLPDYAEGLFRLDENEFIYIIFLFDRNIGQGFKLQLHPRGDESIPKVGMFASRSPFRPNPIGLQRVRLLRVTEQVVTVKGLDAFDGTPVLDIKPAIRYDRRRA